MTVENLNTSIFYPTIQSAVDAASPGDYIQVGSGTYANVTVDKALTLVGVDTGSGLPNINGSLDSNIGSGVGITADDVTLRGFNVTNWRIGIGLESAGCTVSGNTVNNTQCGILVIGSGNALTGNTVNSSGRGILAAADSSDNVFWLNILEGNQYNGIDGGSVNRWNSTVQMSYAYRDRTYTNYIGNYWDNYTGLDANGDGIGDTPFTVPLNNLDYYPIFSSISLVLSAPLVANFTANVSSGVAPLTVQFTNNSTGDNIAGWQWNFSDGVNDTAMDPVHTFSDPGVYTVTLTVTNDGGSSTKQVVNFITVHNAIPVASFTSSAASGNVPLSVQFNDASTGANITGWQWSFGDGTGNSTLQNPAHTYASAGVYSVTLTVMNDGGSCWLQKVSYITVHAASPPGGTIEYISGTIGQAAATVTPTATATATITPTSAPTPTPTPTPEPSVTEQNNGFPWWLLLILLAIIAIAAAAYYLFTRNR